MRNPVKPFLFALALSATAALASSPAMAFDQARGAYSTLFQQGTANGGAKIAASYRIKQDMTREPANVDGASMYYGGEIRTLIVDGSPVRLSEREVIENIRAGRFVPVYTESGARLSREDWEVSLPRWLAHATRDYAGQ